MIAFSVLSQAHNTILGNFLAALDVLLTTLPNTLPAQAVQAHNTALFK
jgi:hypothetical protein